MHLILRPTRSCTKHQTSEGQIEVFGPLLHLANH